MACTFPERVDFPSLIYEADGTAGSLAALRGGSYPPVGGSPQAGSLERRAGFEEGRIVELQVDTKNDKDWIIMIHERVYLQRH